MRKKKVIVTEITHTHTHTGTEHWQNVEQVQDKNSWELEMQVDVIVSVLSSFSVHLKT